MGLLDFTDEATEVIARWDKTIGAPSRENRKKNRLRVYKNPFVEHVLATSHPLLPGLWFGPVIVYGAWLALSSARGLAVGLATFGLGVLAFSLLEYCLHRWVFHFDPGESDFGKTMLFLLHGYHHEFPNDRWRLVAPPLMSWPIAAIVFLLYSLVLPADLVWILFGGTCLGYLAYDWIHYYTHHFRAPKTWVGKRLRRAHAVHHYKLFGQNMGISSPLWDLLFGTFAWSDRTVKEALAATREVENNQH